MPHWVPAVLALAVLLIVALAVVWIHAELDGRHLRRDNADLTGQVRQLTDDNARLRADLTRCVATAALTPDACTTSTPTADAIEQWLHDQEDHR